MSETLGKGTSVAPGAARGERSVLRTLLPEFLDAFQCRRSVRLRFRHVSGDVINRHVERNLQGLA